MLPIEPCSTKVVPELEDVVLDDELVADELALVDDVLVADDVLVDDAALVEDDVLVDDAALVEDVLPVELLPVVLVLDEVLPLLAAELVVVVVAPPGPAVVEPPLSV